MMVDVMSMELYHLAASKEEAKASRGHEEHKNGMNKRP